MNRFWRMTTALSMGIAFLTSTAGAETPAADPVDTSLQHEVENYLATATPVAADEAMTFRVFFKNGINMESGDGNFKMKIGGRLMVDWFWITSDDYDSSITADGVFFRRVRLFMSGEVYKNTIFKVQLDFAGGEDGSPDLKDVYVGLKKLFGGTLKVGHHKEPFSLEELTSSKYITFIERSAPTNAFAPSRNTGASWGRTFGEQKRVWLRLFFGKTTDDSDGSQMENGGYAFTLRIAGIILENKDEGTLLHGGFGFSFRDPNGEASRFRARFGPGKGDRLVDTGSVPADDLTLFNFELAFLWKSFSAQAEFFLASVSAPAGGTDADFTGFYVQISWWLTGESRHYKEFVFSRVTPKENFHDGGAGRGAWELAYRFDSIDLIDGGVMGGEQDTHTFGVNWHWNPNTRVMFNVVFASLDPDKSGTPSTDVTSVIVRWQFDF